MILGSKINKKVRRTGQNNPNLLQLTNKHTSCYYVFNNGILKICVQLEKCKQLVSWGIPISVYYSSILYWPIGRGLTGQLAAATSGCWCHQHSFGGLTTAIIFLYTPKIGSPALVTLLLIAHSQGQLEGMDMWTSKAEGARLYCPSDAHISCPVISAYVHSTTPWYGKTMGEMCPSFRLFNLASTFSSL